MPDKSTEDLPKQTDKLPEHAKHIYKKAHDAALEEYKDPEKRRDNAPLEEVANKVAWAAVKKEYHKEGDAWVRDKEEASA